MPRLMSPKWPPLWLDTNFQKPRPKSRKIITLTGILLFLSLLLLVNHKRADIPNLTSSLDFGHGGGLQYPASARRLWSQLLPLLEDANPNVSPPTVQADAKSEYWEANIEFDLMDKTNMGHNDILRMSRAHQKFLGAIAQHMPKYTPTKYGTKRGIVTVAGGDYLPPAVVSLRMLRRTGSMLPVEVWMADQDEYDAEICAHVLPMLGARCRLLSDVFDAVKVEKSQQIAHFQFKIFAILFSSFDDVLFLDSDSFPLHDPEKIFDSSVYRTKGLITWPDLWAATVSPAYYLIAGQEPPAIIKRASTESGQFLVNKRSHYRTLLIAAYYNYYGPSHYYLLLCQGGFGRGDKSTFVPAAIAADQPFYDVSERPRPIGHMYDWLQIYALIQFDPMEDHALTSQGKWRVKNNTIAAPIRPFFLHTTDPKWNPAKLFGQRDPQEHGFANDPTKDRDGKPSAAYVDPAEDVAMIDYIERQLWEETRWVGCELEDKFRSWKDRKNICKNVQDWFDQYLNVPHIKIGDPPPPPQPPLLSSGQVDEEKKEEAEENKHEVSADSPPVPMSLDASTDAHRKDRHPQFNGDSVKKEIVSGDGAVEAGEKPGVDASGNTGSSSSLSDGLPSDERPAAAAATTATSLDADLAPSALDSS